jgi:hypothetical protein
MSSLLSTFYKRKILLQRVQGEMVSTRTGALATRTYSQPTVGIENI